MIGGRAQVDAEVPVAKDRGAKPTPNSSAARPPSRQQAAAAEQPLNVVAVVNGEEVQRQELAQECLSVYGKEVLESVLNKYLIMQYCQARQINISQADVNEEIDRMARKFGIATDQYLKMLKQERGIKAEQYATDIVWPMLALRRLAKDQIVPSQEEVQTAFEAQYGEAIKARSSSSTTPQRRGKCIRRRRRIRTISGRWQKTIPKIRQSERNDSTDPAAHGTCVDRKGGICTERGSDIPRDPDHAGAGRSKTGANSVCDS